MFASGKPIALRRFAQAIFIGFHVPPKLIWAMSPSATLTHLS